MRTSLLFLAFAFSGWCADPPPGRWQLVPAAVEVQLGGFVVTNQCLFRIDTATGRTWVYRNSLNTPPFGVWRPIDDPDMDPSFLPERMRLLLLHSWIKAHPTGGPFPFETPVRQIDAKEVAILATNLTGANAPPESAIRMVFFPSETK